MPGLCEAEVYAFGAHGGRGLIVVGSAYWSLRVMVLRVPGCGKGLETVELLVRTVG